ncbi:unnamed protein product [Ceratitis capitata]|uniref:(Mediterranean fruit fly) hypothetical protein n=1 Tax=Ceratitis capitata TaxID=7213 RepID=A0A811UUQ8_CERCA|nr:unnamed protein product [Ceratitis capitata]
MYGPLNRNQVIQPRMLHEREPQSLDRLVQELYSVEDFGLRTSNIELDSDDNYQFRKIVEDTTKKISEELIVLARIPMMMSPDEVQRSKSAAQPRTVTWPNVTDTNATRRILYSKEVRRFVNHISERIRHC